MMASRFAGAPLCALLIFIAVCSAQDDPIVLRNANGMEVHLLSTGACVQRLLVPDGAGGTVDVMLGFDDPESYRVRLRWACRQVPGCQAPVSFQFQVGGPDTVQDPS